MDDLKLIAKSVEEIQKQIQTVKTSSDDINMEFGLEKCAKITFKRGKLTHLQNLVIDTNREIQGHSTAVSRRPCCAVVLRRKAWSEHGMASVNQTRPHCVNQMGKTHSKRLAARHGRGTTWARHAMCETAFVLSVFFPFRFNLHINANSYIT